MMNVRMIDVGALAPNTWNPSRLSDEQYQSLLAEIRRHGRVLKPVVVRLDGEAGRYIILDGEHQWRAARDTGLAQVPCEIVDADEFEARRQTVRRNLRGENNPVRYGRLCRKMQGLRTLSNRQLAEELGVSEGHVRNALLYAEAADHCGQVPSWPSEDEIAALPVRRLRALLARLERDEEAPAEAEVAVNLEPPAENSRTVKDMMKTLTKLEKASNGATHEEHAIFWRRAGSRLEALMSLFQTAASVDPLPAGTEAALLPEMPAAPTWSVVPAPAEDEPQAAAPEPEVLRNITQAPASPPRKKASPVEARRPQRKGTAPKVGSRSKRPRDVTRSSRTYGHKVKAAREAKGYSQVELAKIVGTTSSMIDRVEAGKKGLGKTKYPKLDEVLGLLGEAAGPR
jgi:ParB/RepB/Spo0J family partition protein